MADDEEAVVLACTGLVFCALDLHQSQEQLMEKVRWTCPPQFTLWRHPWTRVLRVAPALTGQLADSEFLKIMELLYFICTLNLTLTLTLTLSNIGSV